MQRTLKSIAYVSLFFFIVLGGIHICTSILMAQGIITKANFVLFNILDLPFLFVALLYASSRLALSIEEMTGNLKVPFIVCSSLSALLFLAALYFNFALPDAVFF